MTRWKYKTKQHHFPVPVWSAAGVLFTTWAIGRVSCGSATHVICGTGRRILEPTNENTKEYKGRQTAADPEVLIGLFETTY